MTANRTLYLLSLFPGTLVSVTAFAKSLTDCTAYIATPDSRPTLGPESQEEGEDQTHRVAGRKSKCWPSVRTMGGGDSASASFFSIMTQ